MEHNYDLNLLRNILAPGISLQEAIELLENDFTPETLPVAVYVEPPEPAVLTDEESGDEEEVGDLRHLSGRQLRARAELIFPNRGLVDDLLEEDDESTIAVPSTLSPPPTTPLIANIISKPSSSSDPFGNSTESWIKERSQKGKPVPKFIEGDFEKKDLVSETQISEDTLSESCTEVFERFFSEEVIELLRNETEKYILFKNCEPQNITSNEIRCFIGFLIVSGYNELPSSRNYWEEDDDMHNSLVSKAMRRNRMQTILRFIHSADNTCLDPNDKLWKPLINIIKKNCFRNYMNNLVLNYDESMVRFFGRHGLKQFLPKKPIRFGFKMWCVNSSDGYLLNFDMYQGKNSAIKEEYYNLFGKSSAPFVTMLDELPDEIQRLPLNFFFDNLFSGVNLFAFLKQKGYTATGTFRENRIPKVTTARAKNMKYKRKRVTSKGKIQKTRKGIAVKIPPKTLTDKSRFSKMPRGKYEILLEKRDGISFVRWKDNGIVTVGSTAFGVQPISTVKRYSQELKKNVNVSRPYALCAYNKGMGGTDLMDNNISNYRIGVRSKKWWWPIFTWLIDASIQNAWILYKKKDANMSQLKFRRNIAQTYLTKFATPRIRPGRTSKASVHQNFDVRYDNIGHFVVSTPEKKRRRFASSLCDSRVRTMCQKCDVGLCVDCFIPYHSLQ